MSYSTGELLLQLGRTTLVLSLAVLVVAALLRAARIASPAVHRGGWLLALALGWTFLQWPVAVAWYEPPSAPASVAVLSLSERPALPPDVAAIVPARVEAQFVEAKSVEAPSVEVPSAEALRQAAVEFDTALAQARDELAPVALQEGLAPADVVAGEAPSSEHDELAALPLPAGAAADTISAEQTSANTIPGAWWTRLATAALGAWLAGILFLVAAWLVGYARFVRRLPESQPVEAEWHAQWQELLAEHEVSTAIPLRVTADAGPMLCRLPRGYELLVPAPLWRELGQRERAFVLRHELAHFIRGDVWSSLTVRVLALPHWFNPLAWWAVRRFDEASEWACDQAATADEPVTAYARTLLRMGEAAGRQAAYTPAVRGRPLASRIRRVLSRLPEHDSPWRRGLFAAVALCMALAALVRVDLVAQEPAVEATAAPVAAAEQRDATLPDELLPAEPDSKKPATTNVTAALTFLLKAHETQPAVGLPAETPTAVPPAPPAPVAPPTAPKAPTALVAPPAPQAPAATDELFATVAPATPPSPLPTDRGAAIQVTVRPAYPQFVDAARAGYEAASAAYATDTITLHELVAWSERWMLAEEEGVILERTVYQRGDQTSETESKRPPSTGERIKAVLAHRDRLKKTQAHVEKLFQAGARGGEAEKKALMDYLVAKAEVRLQKLHEQREVEKDLAERAAAGGTFGPSDLTPLQGTGSIAAPARPAAIARPAAPAPAPQPTLAPPPHVPAPVAVAQPVPASVPLTLLPPTTAATPVEAGQPVVPSITVKPYASISATKPREAVFAVPGKPAAPAAKQELVIEIEESERRAPTPDKRTQKRLEELRRQMTRLQQMVAERNEQLIRQTKEIEALERHLGIGDRTIERLPAQLQALDEAQAALKVRIDEYDGEIEKYRLDVKLASDPSTRRARVAERAAADERLAKYDSELIALEHTLENLDDATTDDKTQKKLELKRQMLMQKIAARRQDLEKQSREEEETVQLRRLQGNLDLATMRHERLKAQWQELAKEKAQLTERLSAASGHSGQLDLKKRDLRVLEKVVEELNFRLHRLAIELQEAQDQAAAEAGDDKSAHRRREDRLKQLTVAIADRQKTFERENKELKDLGESLKRDAATSKKWREAEAAAREAAVVLEKRSDEVEQLRINLDVVAKNTPAGDEQDAAVVADDKLSAAKRDAEIREMQLRIDTAEKSRDAAARQLADRQRAAEREKQELDDSNLNSTEYDNKAAKLKILEAFIDDMQMQLHKLSTEKALEEKSSAP